MKKFFAVLLLASLTVCVTAQEFKIGGEVKTGLLQTMENDHKDTPQGDKGNRTQTRANSKDDAGNGSGLFRINLEYSINNFGIKARLEMYNWINIAGQNMPAWSYAFGYGKVLDDQITFSLGKLGLSPWGTGGPELDKELEVIESLGGMRLEWEPNFAPGLNVGFVINAFDSSIEKWSTNLNKPVSLLDILQESVVGISYTHDLFMIRAAYRFDSEVDQEASWSNTNPDATNGREGGKLVYRVEEHAIEKVLPGFNIWALGYWHGLGRSAENKYLYAEGNDDFDPRNWQYDAQNWLFIQYAPDFLTAQLRAGYDVIADRQIVHLKPSVYIHLFDKLLTFGGFFHWGQDFGDGKAYKGSPYAFMEYEPLIQFNMTPNSYIAVAYNWRKDYVSDPDGAYAAANLEPTREIQWINVRVGMSF